MCSAARRHLFANGGSLVLKSLKHIANAAALRPARFGLIGASRRTPAIGVRSPEKRPLELTFGVRYACAFWSFRWPARF